MSNKELYKVWSKWFLPWLEYRIQEEEKRVRDKNGLDEALAEIDEILRPLEVK